MSHDEDRIRRILGDPERETKLVDASSKTPILPMIGWSTATVSDRSALLTLELLLPAPMDATLVRMSMTRAQCSELADALRRLATDPLDLPEKAN